MNYPYYPPVLGFHKEKKRRIRVRSTLRWSDEETMLLLNAIQAKIDGFEVIS